VLAAFRRFGATRATVMMDRMTGRSRGFGFVFVARDAADEALDVMHGKVLDGRRVSVTKAVPEQQTVPGTPAGMLAAGRGFRGGGRGGRGGRDSAEPWRGQRGGRGGRGDWCAISTFRLTVYARLMHRCLLRILACIARERYAAEHSNAFHARMVSKHLHLRCRHDWPGRGAKAGAMRDRSRGRRRGSPSPVGRRGGSRDASASASPGADHSRSHSRSRSPAGGGGDRRESSLQFGSSERSDRSDDSASVDADGASPGARDTAGSEEPDASGCVDHVASCICVVHACSLSFRTSSCANPR
jgi:RNA recognition motif-containing protein